MDTSGRIRYLQMEDAPKDWDGFVEDWRRPSTKFEAMKLIGKELKRNEIPLKNSEAEKLRRMSIPKRKNWMRNHSCPCGSGKKMKRCCWSKLALGGVRV